MMHKSFIKDLEIDTRKGPKLTQGPSREDKVSCTLKQVEYTFATTHQ